jgi:hypothetical protein
VKRNPRQTGERKCGKHCLLTAALVAASPALAFTSKNVESQIGMLVPLVGIWSNSQEGRKKLKQGVVHLV